MKSVRSNNRDFLAKNFGVGCSLVDWFIECKFDMMITKKLLLARVADVETLLIRVFFECIVSFLLSTQKKL